MKSVSQNTRSIGIMTILGIVNGILGVAYSVILARLFGLSRGLEVYFAAFTLVNTFGGLTQSNQLADIYLPLYHRLVASNDKKYAFKTFSITLNYITLAFIPLTLILWFAGFFLIKIVVPGFNSEDHILGMTMFRVIIATTYLNVINPFLSVVLNAEKQYGNPEFVNVLSNVFRIALTLVLSAYWGVWAVAISLVLWTASRTIGYFILLYRIGYRHYWRIHLEGYKPSILFRNIYSTTFSQIALQGYFIALNAGLSFLPQGFYGIYKYVQSFFDGVSAIILWPINRVFYTSFSKAFNESKASLKLLLDNAYSRTFAIIAFFNVIFISIAKPLLSILWLGKKFDASSIDNAYYLTITLFLLLFTEGYFYTVRRVIITYGYTRIYFHSTTISYILSTGITFLVIPRWGILGVYVSIISFQFIRSIISLLLMKIKIKELPLFFPIGNSWKWIAAGFVGLLAGYMTSYAVPYNQLMASLTGRAILVLLNSSVVCGITLISSFLFKTDEIAGLVNSLRSRSGS